MLWLLHAGLCIVVMACGSNSSSIQTGSAILRVLQTELPSRSTDLLARQSNHSSVDQTPNDRRRYASVIATVILQHACNLTFSCLTYCTWWVDSLHECSHTTDHDLDIISNFATCLLQCCAAVRLTTSAAQYAAVYAVPQYAKSCTVLLNLGVVSIDAPRCGHANSAKFFFAPKKCFSAVR